MSFDPRLDLQLQRDVHKPVADVWRAWTEPEVLMRWFCPRPWKVVACDIDLRPGGIFKTVMQSPEGENMPPNVGTYLVVEPERRLVWTNALGPDFRPQAVNANQALVGFVFVVELRLDPLPNGGTHYWAQVRHATELDRQTHADMGFEQGWNAALDQLLELP